MERRADGADGDRRSRRKTEEDLRVTDRLTGGYLKLVMGICAVGQSQIHSARLSSNHNKMSLDSTSSSDNKHSRYEAKAGNKLEHYEFRWSVDGWDQVGNTTSHNV